MKLRVFTAFSGYDSQCMALDRLKEHNPDFDYELVGWAEIDKYAIQAHDAVYPQWKDRNFGDISKIDWEQVPDFDLFTYSSPCQDFSQAGKQAGGTEGSGTRSSLLWECRRAILAKRPKYLLMENVAALVSQKFIRLFNAWQLELESYGYRNAAKVLNAKDYGVPQNRERIFMVSILDESARYEFPQPMPLTLRLKDVLEDKVDERYYLSEKSIKGSWDNLKPYDCFYYNQMPDFTRPPLENIGRTVKADVHAPAVAEPQVLGWVRDKEGNVVKRPVVEVANCVTSGKRENTQNYVMEPTIIQKGRGFNKGGEHENCPTITKNSFECNNSVAEPKPQVLGNIYESQGQNGDIFDPNGLAPTLRSGQGVKGRGVGSCNSPKIAECTYRIRKLTERECFRLMDVPEAYIDRIQQAGISRSQQYKMAGNSIVVSCMYHIWRRLWIDTHITTLTLF